MAVLFSFIPLSHQIPRQLPDGADFRALWSVAQPRSRQPGCAAQRPASYDLRHWRSFLLRNAHLLRSAEDQHEMGSARRVHASLHARGIPLRLARSQFLRRAHVAYPGHVKKVMMINGNHFCHYLATLQEMDSRRTLITILRKKRAFACVRCFKRQCSHA